VARGSFYDFAVDLPLVDDAALETGTAPA